MANPASDIVLPKLPQRLPRAVLTVEEAEAVLAQPDVTLPEGLRDRAMLEVLYATGLRRAELSRLLLFDVDATRGTVFVREGKGRKDRVVPAGERALAWTLKYLEEARPKLVGVRDEGVLFLGDAGEGLHVDYLTQRVRQYIEAAGLGEAGRVSSVSPLDGDGHAGGRRRRALRAGDVGAREPRDDAAVHARHRGKIEGGACSNAPGGAPDSQWCARYCRRR